VTEQETVGKKVIPIALTEIENCQYFIGALVEPYGKYSLPKCRNCIGEQEKGISEPRRHMNNTQAYRYWAFISYNSKDATMARWLHRAIETYGIPAQIAGQYTPTGEPAPKRFHPIFKDREEMPAAPNLTSHVVGALRASRYLIVLCSPNAAASTWVNKEIEMFISLGRKDRIFAFVVSGTPPQCFPPALKLESPLAADARTGADGKANAKLKLLAGMLGVSYDALKQRDSHRRLRRLQLYLSIASMLVVAFGVLASYATQQRDRAVKSRNQAEDILQFLVFELRDELREMGRLELAERVQKQVDHYFLQNRTENLATRSLRNQIAAFENRGRLAIAKGNEHEALGLFRQALDSAEKMVQAEPTSVEWQHNLSLANQNVGDILRSQGKLIEALAVYKRSLDISERIAQYSPANETLQRAASVSSVLVGDVLSEQGELDNALTTYQKASHVLERLVAVGVDAKPVLQDDLAGLHGRIGHVMFAKEDLATAHREYRSAVTISENLVKGAPENVEWQRSLASCYANMGEVTKAQGDIINSLYYYRKDVTIRAALSSSDPLNISWQEDLMEAKNGIAMVLEAQNNRIESLTTYRQVIAIGEVLLQRNSANRGPRRNMATAYRKMSDILQRQGDASGGLHAIGNSIAFLEKLINESPANIDLKRELCMSNDVFGAILLSQNDADRALEAFEKSLVVRRSIVDTAPTNGKYQRDLAVSHSNIGDALSSLGQTAESLSSYQRSLTIFERLAQSRLTDPRKQDDIEATCWNMALMLTKAHDPRAQIYSSRAYDVLLNLKKTGTTLTASQQEHLAVFERQTPNAR
jgi:tetratricopeptide (TPR) repeat protein